jgi:hypothetical protein
LEESEDTAGGSLGKPHHDNRCRKFQIFSSRRDSFFMTPSDSCVYSVWMVVVVVRIGQQICVSVVFLPVVSPGCLVCNFSLVVAAAVVGLVAAPAPSVELIMKLSPPCIIVELSRGVHLKPTIKVHCCSERSDKIVIAIVGVVECREMMKM